MWVFGYGSLIWKADFPFDQKLVGHITGYLRRFYQLCMYHRGTRTHPGRVVTLIRSANPNSQVWGVAYKINEVNTKIVQYQLDFRERGGYSRQKVTFYPVDKNHSPFDLDIYIGNERNELYDGPRDIETIAKQVVSSEGVSGTNIEYVYRLAAGMRKIAPGVEDTHLFRLEKAVMDFSHQKNKYSV